MVELAQIVSRGGYSARKNSRVSGMGHGMHVDSIGCAHADAADGPLAASIRENWSDRLGAERHWDG